MNSAGGAQGVGAATKILECCRRKVLIPAANFLPDGGVLPHDRTEPKSPRAFGFQRRPARRRPCYGRQGPFHGGDRRVPPPDKSVLIKCIPGPVPPDGGTVSGRMAVDDLAATATRCCPVRDAVPGCGADSTALPVLAECPPSACWRRGAETAPRRRRARSPLQITGPVGLGPEVADHLHRRLSVRDMHETQPGLGPGPFRRRADKIHFSHETDHPPLTDHWPG